jgi:hypothetical protein
MVPSGNSPKMRFVRMRISNRGLRTIRKLGVEAALLKTARKAIQLTDAHDHQAHIDRRNRPLLHHDQEPQAEEWQARAAQVRSCRAEARALSRSQGLITRRVSAAMEVQTRGPNSPVSNR